MRSYSTTTSTKADSFRRLEVITGVGRRRRWTDEEKSAINVSDANRLLHRDWHTAKKILESLVTRGILMRRSKTNKPGFPGWLGF
jgi:hypothetical protein